MNKRRLLKGFAGPGIPLAIASAALFGASTPFAKLLLGEGTTPWLLAGLLYLGSGLGLGLVYLFRRARELVPSEAPLRTSDIPWLLLIVVSGGVAAPLLLMVGLATTSASSASLLLNLEGLATMAIAWVAFRENVDKRLLLGAAAILAGAIVLSSQAGSQGFGFGGLAIAAACVAWGIDNNLTRKLSSADPLQISLIKGLAAGSVNLMLALLAGSHLPPLSTIIYAGLIGFFGYGLSLVFFVLGLRLLGTARTGAYFSTAPFVGALLAVMAFGEPLTPRLLIATALMIIGLYFHLAERHVHKHVHAALEHEHRHVHDAHHQHDVINSSGEAHSHWHRHEPTEHTHPHYPDLHHRHTH